MATGLPVSLLGLALRAWASGHLAKDQRLATCGPYAYTRNPLYLGSVLVATGIAIASQSVILAVLLAAVFLLIYLPAIGEEEEHLRKLFPAYAGYAAKVPRLRPAWPGLRADQTFQFDQYLKNREYEALLGFLAAVLWLCVKLWWIK